ncbi:MAG TPA: hypothetical protein VK597_09295, partial [Inquilinus sp.]|nr:hypothetical protein [Inquilinus sp.]
LEPSGLSVFDVARAIGVSPPLLMSFIAGAARLYPDLARRLGRHFDVDPQWWIDMQANWDRESRGDDVIGGLSGIVPVRKAG